MVIFASASAAAERKEGLGITMADFIDKLGYACSRVPNGITEKQIDELFDFLEQSLNAAQKQFEKHIAASSAMHTG